MNSPVRSSADPTWERARDRILEASKAGSVIWDFDGVVADSEPVHAESYRRLLRRRQYEPEEHFFLPLIGHTEREIWEMLRSDGAPVDADVDELILERREAFLELALEALQPSWLVADLAGDFESVADCQLIVSNGDPTTIRTLLRAWHLDDLLLTPDNTESPTVTKRVLLEQLWASGSTVTIEDNGGYLARASAAGSFCVAVRHSTSPAEGITGDIEVQI